MLVEDLELSREAQGLWLISGQMIREITFNSGLSLMGPSGLAIKVSLLPSKILGFKD
jgi:hypothetical protein